MAFTNRINMISNKYDTHIEKLLVNFFLHHNLRYILGFHYNIIILKL